MKRTFYLVLTILLFVPVFVLADTDYHKAVTAANDYIRSFPNYDEYFLTGENATLVYDQVNKKAVYSNRAYPEFTHGALLSRYEYEISNSGLNCEGRENPARCLSNDSLGKSYLSPGVRYWLVKNDINYYYEELETKRADSPFVQNGVRVTALVLPKTQAPGRGTSNSPWDLSTTVSHVYEQALFITSSISVERTGNNEIAEGYNVANSQLLNGDTLIYKIRIENKSLDDEYIPFELTNYFKLANAKGHTINEIFTLDKESSKISPAGHYAYDIEEIYNQMNNSVFYGAVKKGDTLELEFHMKVTAAAIGAEITMQPTINSRSYRVSPDPITVSIERLVTFNSISETIPSSNIVFVVDMSGSMSAAKLKGVRQSLYSFINYVFPDPASSAKANIIITTFSTQKTEKVIGTAKNYDESIQLKQLIYDSIKTGGGNTSFVCGMNIACAVLYGNSNCSHKKCANNYSNLPNLDPSYHDYIIFLSDGAPTDSPKDLFKEVIKNNIEKMESISGHGVDIYAIGYGTGADNAILQDVARRITNRVFASDVDNLINTFNRIYEDIGESVGNYPTTKGAVDMTDIVKESISNKITITIKDKATGQEEKRIYSTVEEIENSADGLIHKDANGRYVVNCTDFGTKEVIIGFYPKSIQERNAHLTNYTIDVDFNGGGAASGKTYPKSATFEDEVTLAKPVRSVKINYNRNGSGGVKCNLFNLLWCNGNQTIKINKKNADTNQSKNMTFTGWSFGDSVNYDIALQYSSGWVSLKENGLHKATRYKYLTLNANSVVKPKANWSLSQSLYTVTTNDSNYKCAWNTQANGKGEYFASGGTISLGSIKDNEITLYAICRRTGAVTLRTEINENNCLNTDGETAKCDVDDMELLSNQEYKAPSPTLYVVGKEFKGWKTFYKKNKNKKEEIVFQPNEEFDTSKLYTTKVNDMDLATFTADWKSCPRGKYNDGTSLTCTSCPNEFTTAGEGATSIEDCYVHLSKGQYYSDVTNSVKLCEQGRYSSYEGDMKPSERFDCSICDEGLTTNGAGSTSIKDCHSL